MKMRGISTVVVLLALGAPSLAAAQDAGPGDAPAREDGTDASGGAQVSASALAEQGKQAYEAGKWKEAIGYYQRAESLEHSPTHLLYWARAAEKLGKLVQARENYQAVVDDVAEDDEVAQMQEEAQTALAALEPRMPWVTIVVKGADIDTEVQVTVDGQPLMPGTLSVKQPIDPGTHEFRTRSGKLEGKPVTATFSEGQHQEVSLELPVDEKPAPLVRREPAALPPREREPAMEPMVPEEPPPSESGSPGLRIAGYATLGLGVVGLGMGTVFGLQTNSKNDDIRSLCGNVQSCPRDVEPDVRELRDDAKSSGTLATVGFIVGGVGVATGATLLLVSMGDSSDPSVDAGSQEGATLSAWVGPQSLGIRGTF